MQNCAMRQTNTKRSARSDTTHGEWWFNVFENGGLNVRRARSQTIKGRPKTIKGRSKTIKEKKRVLIIENIEVVSPTDLDYWATKLNTVADDFDDLAWQYSVGGGDR